MVAASLPRRNSVVSHPRRRRFSGLNPPNNIACAQVPTHAATWTRASGRGSDSAIASQVVQSAIADTLIPSHLLFTVDGPCRSYGDERLISSVNMAPILVVKSKPLPRIPVMVGFLASTHNFQPPAC